MPIKYDYYAFLTVIIYIFIIFFDSVYVYSSRNEVFLEG